MAMYGGSRASFEAYKALDEKMRKERDQEGMRAWMKWGEEHKDAIVDNGAPLGKTKRISKDGIADTRNEIGAYTIVQAESHEDAAKLFENHPHFTIFPGEWVEVMECLPMPKME